MVGKLGSVVQDPVFKMEMDRERRWRRRCLREELLDRSCPIVVHHSCTPVAEDVSLEEFLFRTALSLLAWPM
jgi:hypothetical protein